MRGSSITTWRIAALLGVCGSSSATTFYIGGSVAYHAVSAQISGTNPLKMFIERNKTTYENIFDDYYANVADVKQDESFNDAEFEAVNPEVSLLDRMVHGGGISLWGGTGKRTEKRFYCGGEVRFSYKLVSADVKNHENLVFDEKGEGAMYLRNLISGTVSANSNIRFKKDFEIALGVRLGFFASERLLGYLTTGVSWNQNDYDRCQVTMNPNLNIRRLNDDTSAWTKSNWKSNWVQALQHEQYFVTTGRHSYACLHIGLGADYFIKQKIFARVEYLYKFAFTNHLRFKHYTEVTDDSYKAYAIRYQDSENCFSLGIGRAF